MTHIIAELEQAGLITPPSFLSANICLLSIGGSYSYGTSNDTSDIDIIGTVIPTRDMVFSTKIQGFDDIPKFEDYQQHHIQYNGKEYDIKIYSLVKLFKLASAGNPNILDFIKSPDHCILYSNKVGDEIRRFGDNFMSKSSIDKYFGFSYNHLKSAEGRIKSGVYPDKRKDLWEKFGYDTKDIAHCIRCLLSLNDMLMYQSYNVARHANYIKSIRNGNLSFEKAKIVIENIKTFIKEYEKYSPLRETVDKDLVRSKLLELLEEGWKND